MITDQQNQLKTLIRLNFQQALQGLNIINTKIFIAKVALYVKLIS